MKKGITFDEYMKELEEKKARAEAFKEVITHLDNEIKWKCDKIVEQEGWSEEYTDDEGNTKTRWHSTVYKTDENGDDILIPPSEDSYGYEDYMALLKVKDEILAII